MIEKELKQKIFVDMDDVLVDFSGARKLYPHKSIDELDTIHGFYGTLQPLPGAIESFKWLSEIYEVHILSTAPWDNPSAWTDKRLWVEQYLGEEANRRLTLSHHKNLFTGRALIDDRMANGASDFQGEHIHFGSDKFPNWRSVIEYLEKELAVK